VTALHDGGFAIPRNVLDATGVPKEEAGHAPVLAFAIRFGGEAWLVDVGGAFALGRTRGGCLKRWPRRASRPAGCSGCS
jgi:hypothetical protein